MILHQTSSFTQTISFWCFYRHKEVTISFTSLLYNIFDPLHVTLPWPALICMSLRQMDRWGDHFSPTSFTGIRRDKKTHLPRSLVINIHLAKWLEEVWTGQLNYFSDTFFFIITESAPEARVSNTCSGVRSTVVTMNRWAPLRAAFFCLMRKDAAHLNYNILKTTELNYYRNNHLFS